MDSFHKLNGPCLWGNLQDAIKEAIKNSLALRPIEKAIWKACMLVLKLENFVNYDLISSVDKLQNYLSINSNDFFILLQEKIYKWAVDAIENNVDKVYMEVKDFISGELLKFWEVQFYYSKTYLENKIDSQKNDEKKSLNIYSDPHTGLEFEIATIHSVKGETHLATLYLETYFQNDGGKNQHSYESQRLIDQLKGIQINSDEQKKRKKQSAKMVYVGFSRPKYLLCFAAQKEHFDDESH